MAFTRPNVNANWIDMLSQKLKRKNKRKRKTHYDISFAIRFTYSHYIKKIVTNFEVTFILLKKEIWN